MPKTISNKLAAVVEQSENSKIGNMSATYTGYQTCPDSCPLKPEVQPDGNFKVDLCYGSSGMVACTMRRLTMATVRTSATLVQIQQAECTGIEALKGDKPLRLKAAGDTPNTRYAKGLAKACKTYTNKHGKPAYGYTHNWSMIPRSAFGEISILASCDTVEDIGTAKAKGYATATVVSHFPNGSKVFQSGGHNIVPCPNQVAEAQGRDLTCEQCMLCAHDGVLKTRNLTVGLIAHGTKATTFKTQLANNGQ